MMVIDVPKFDSYSKDYEDYILGLIEKLKDSFDSNLLEHPDFFLELKKAICSDGKFELSGEGESLVVSSVRDFPDDTNGYYKAQEISKKTTIKLDGTNLDYLRVENVEMSLFSFDSKDKKEISLAFDVFLYKQGMEEANLSYQRGNRVLMKGASLGPELSLIQELGKVSLNGFGRMPETSDKIPSWLYLRNRSSKFKNIVLVGGEKKMKMV